MQLQELNNRFTEVNMKLLLCIVCLNPIESYYAFDKRELICFAQFYSFGFFMVKLVTLDNQLETFILDMRSCEKNSKLKEINDHDQILVKTKKFMVYSLFFIWKISINFTRGHDTSRENIFNNEIG